MCVCGLYDCLSGYVYACECVVCLSVCMGVCTLVCVYGLCDCTSRFMCVCVREILCISVCESPSFRVYLFV